MRARVCDVQLTGIRKLYDGVARPVIPDLDLDIADGEMVVLVGPSGCGKSTTLRMVAGPRGADRRRRSRSTAATSTTCRPRDRDIAMVFQSYALYPHMTVFENMAFGLRIKHAAPRPRSRRRVDARPPTSSASSRYLERRPQGAVGRPAPARRDRPRDRAPAQGVPVRRAAVEPRREAARRHARARSRASTSARSATVDVRHARSDRGDDARRSDRRAQGRRRPADRHAASTSTSGRRTGSSPASSARRR